MELKGKRIVVTGAGSGIGLELVKQLASYEGVKILAVDLNVESVPKSGPIQTLVCDLSEPTGTDAVIAKAKASFGGIDLYFANAGFAYYERLGTPDWEHASRIYQVNVLTPIYSFQRVRDLAGDSDFRVVITASAMGYMPIPGFALYGATKAALVSFAQALRWELRDPCSLTLLNPIATRSNFFKQGGGHSAPIPFPSQTPAQVARAAIRGVERDQRDIFPSKLFVLTLLSNRLFPWGAWIYQRYQLSVLERWLAEKPAVKRLDRAS